MNKRKWILLGALMLIPLLLRKLLANLGWQISSEASTWLLLMIIAFFVVAIAVPKEHQKWAKWFTVLFLLLFLSSTCFKSCGRKNQNQGQTVTISTAPPTLTVWQENVEVTGKEVEGKIAFVKEAGWYEIDYTGGVIYDTPEAKIRGAYYNIWGTDYDREWRKYFIYSNIPGVKALEALVVVDGEVGSETGKICQFPDGKMSFRIWVEKYVCFFRHEPFRPDINGNRYHCFQNNYGSWKFRIRKVAD